MINAPQLTDALTSRPSQSGESAEKGQRTHGADVRPRRGPQHPNAAKVCFWLGLLALSAALVGCVVNSLLTGWMAVAGMAAIGLFYLGLSSIAAGQMHSPISEPADDSSPESRREVT